MIFNQLSAFSQSKFCLPQASLAPKHPSNRLSLNAAILKTRTPKELELFSKPLNKGFLTGQKSQEIGLQKQESRHDSIKSRHDSIKSRHDSMESRRDFSFCSPFFPLSCASGNDCLPCPLISRASPLGEWHESASRKLALPDSFDYLCNSKPTLGSGTRRASVAQHLFIYNDAS